jgi:hypothetical protein
MMTIPFEHCSVSHTVSSSAHDGPVPTQLTGLHILCYLPTSPNSTLPPHALKILATLLYLLLPQGLCTCSSFWLECCPLVRYIGWALTSWKACLTVNSPFLFSIMLPCLSYVTFLYFFIATWNYITNLSYYCLLSILPWGLESCLFWSVFST